MGRTRESANLVSDNNIFVDISNDLVGIGVTSPTVELDVSGNAKDPMTVLDSECRLRGISKLRVIDASVMPSITSGNTNAPVMLIAETIAKKILRKN